MDDFIQRTGITLEQLIVLIRIGALRFTGKNKKQLLWEAHALLNKSKKVNCQSLFYTAVKEYKLPEFETSAIEDAYDEIELLGWPVTISFFDLLRTDFRGEIQASKLVENIGNTIRVVGNFITAKYVPTVRREVMAFGAFLDTEGNFFDTTHFPQSFKQYPFKGNGAYLIKGKVVEEFGYPSIEVEQMAILPIKPDPRSI